MLSGDRRDPSGRSASASSPPLGPEDPLARRPPLELGARSRLCPHARPVAQAVALAELERELGLRWRPVEARPVRELALELERARELEAEPPGRQPPGQATGSQAPQPQPEHHPQMARSPPRVGAAPPLRELRVRQQGPERK